MSWKSALKEINNPQENFMRVVREQSVKVLTREEVELLFTEKTEKSHQT